MSPAIPRRVSRRAMAWSRSRRTTPSRKPLRGWRPPASAAARSMRAGQTQPWRWPHRSHSLGARTGANPGQSRRHRTERSGLARNHGFADGNKRTAWVAARLFLADNGYRLRFEPMDAVRTVEAVAAGALDELALAAWFRDRLVGP